MINLDPKKFSELDTASSIDGEEYIPIVKAGENKKVQIKNLPSNGGGSVSDWGDIGGTLSNQTDLQAALDAKANTSHNHTASQVTDFDTEVSNNTDVAANTTARHTHSNKTILDNTSASFTSADETKLDAIEALADVTDAGNVGSSIHGATAKTTPVDTDTVPLIDSAASNVLKKVSWSNIKATLKTYFDTLYAAISHTHAQSDITNLSTDLNAKANDADVVHDTGDETVAGVKTFSSSPIVPTPTTDFQAATKKYVDDNAGGGGISDGDKGDVTVSSSGTVWTIDNDVVTYAKMQNISATSRILGRITTGAGDAEELTASDVRTIINVEDGADVTDATNVNAAGAVMNSDTTTADMSFVIDEDNMASDSATKVPTQQSVKAYADTKSTASKTETLTNKTIDANGTGNSITNIEVADFASGVLDTDLSSVSASDDTLPSAKATKTYADTKKTDSMSTNKLLGRGTAGTGAIEEITLGTNLSLSGTTLNASGGGGGSADPNDENSIIGARFFGY